MVRTDRTEGRGGEKRRQKAHYNRGHHSVKYVHLCCHSEVTVWELRLKSFVFKMLLYCETELYIIQKWFLVILQAASLLLFMHFSWVHGDLPPSGPSEGVPKPRPPFRLTPSAMIYWKCCQSKNEDVERAGDLGLFWLLLRFSVCRHFFMYLFRYRFWFTLKVKMLEVICNMKLKFNIINVQTKTL